MGGSTWRWCPSIARRGAARGVRVVALLAGAPAERERGVGGVRGGAGLDDGRRRGVVDHADAERVAGEDAEDLARVDGAGVGGG